MDRTSHVHFMASKSGVLYLGVTSNLPVRVGQHKAKILPGFTKKYNVTKLLAQRYSLLLQCHPSGTQACTSAPARP
jgi:predicted GIY-YIG superfamily endonuclease